MDYYEIWCNLKDSSRDLQFCEHVEAFLNALKGEGLLADFKIRRRKFGFGPAELGEFNISIATTNLHQLEDAFQRVAAWTPDIQRLHALVYSAVTNVKFGLWRDFPDPVRLDSARNLKSKA